MTSVEKWMAKNPITIDQDASIIEAIHLMKEKGIRRLPVMAKGQFTGLITERMIKDYMSHSTKNSENDYFLLTAVRLKLIKTEELRAMAVAHLLFPMPFVKHQKKLHARHQSPRDSWRQFGV